MALSPILCGVLVEWISEYLGKKLELVELIAISVEIIQLYSSLNAGYEDDSAAFIIGAVFTVIALPLLAKLDVKVKKNEKSILSTIKHIMGMLDFNVFILVELIMGMCHGFHPIYRPVFATELQASKTLIGATY